MKLTLPEFQVDFSKLVAGMIATLLLAAVWGCSKSFIIKVDGSSTVFPITEAMAEEFQKRHGELRTTVGISGTGGGFQKFCNGEIHVVGASRPIKPVEVGACARKGVDYIELPVAIDGITIIANPENDWVKSLTIGELGQIWRPGSTIKKWSDVRPEWPGKDIFLVGADTDSGTFEYFTKATVGEEGASRPDYTASADDNVLVQAVAGEKYALGYIGFAYYSENAHKLKLVSVDPGTGPVGPSEETITDGRYKPLSRPLFIYVNRQDAERPEVREFVRFFLNSESGKFIREVGYVALPERLYELVRERFERGITGSVFEGMGTQVGISLQELLELE